MNGNLKLDDTGYALIERLEGSRRAAYKDSAGIPTIGIGFIRYTLGAKAGQKGHTDRSRNQGGIFKPSADLRSGRAPIRARAADAVAVQRLRLPLLQHRRDGLRQILRRAPAERKTLPRRLRSIRPVG